MDRSDEVWQDFANSMYLYLDKFFGDIFNYENSYLKVVPLIIVEKNKFIPKLYGNYNENLLIKNRDIIVQKENNTNIKEKFLKWVCYESKSENIKISIVLDFGEIIELYQNEIFEYFISYDMFDFIINCIVINISSFIQNKISGDNLFKMTQSDQLESFVIIHKLFDNFDKIYNDYYNYIDKLLIDLSNLNYENEKNTGMIIFTNENKLLVKLVNEIKVASIFNLNYKNQINYLRKLLQTTNNQVGLIFDGTSFIGIDRLENYPNCATVQFKKGNTFVLSEYTNGQKEDIMQVKNGRLMLPRMKVDKPIFESKLKGVFNTLNEEKINNLFEIVQAASEQSHGTTIVIMDKEKAKTEVSTERLGGVSTKIELKSLKEEGKDVDKDLMHSITSIDGAVLIDTDGDCHAISVILDGVYNGGGEQGRGARYNSANTYANSNKDVLCIVFSEDGHINYLYQNKKMK